jgi:hypothetical protein
VSNPVDALILDLLEWIGNGGRPYTEVMEAWRTSCPRLPVWEEANRRGFLDHHHDSLSGRTISVSAPGLEHLHCARVQTAGVGHTAPASVETAGSLLLPREG